MQNWAQENDRDSEQNLLDVTIDDADMADEPEQTEENDLPQDFTSKIISAIKRQVKEKGRDQPPERENAQDSSLSAQEPIDVEDSAEDNGNRKRLHKNKSKNDEEEWRQESAEKSPPKAKRGRPRKIYTDSMNRREKDREPKQQKDQKESEKKMNKMRGRPSINSNPVPQQKKFMDINQIQQTLKTYFESYLTTILEKMQDVTNDKLVEITSRLKRIEAALPPQQHSQQISQQSNGHGNRQNYIKLDTKLISISRIDRGESTIASIAQQLNIPSKVVQNWLVSKQQLREEAKKRNRR